MYWNFIKHTLDYFSIVYTRFIYVESEVTQQINMIIWNDTTIWKIMSIIFFIINLEINKNSNKFKY